MEQTKKERTMTSAIQELDVRDVRKGLTLLRDAWANHSARTPICPSQPMMRIFNTQDPDNPKPNKCGEEINSEDLESTEDSTVLTFESFCFKFVMGQHNKRHNKSEISKKTKPPQSGCSVSTTLGSSSSSAPSELKNKIIINSNGKRPRQTNTMDEQPPLEERKTKARLRISPTDRTTTTTTTITFLNLEIPTEFGDAAAIDAINMSATTTTTTGNSKTVDHEHMGCTTQLHVEKRGTIDFLLQSPDSMFC